MNSVAVVTGASQGIGEAIAVSLAENNYDVILIAQTSKKLHAVKNKIVAMGK